MALKLFMLTSGPQKGNERSNESEPDRGLASVLCRDVTAWASGEGGHVDFQNEAVFEGSARPEAVVPLKIAEERCQAAEQRRRLEG